MTVHASPISTSPIDTADQDTLPHVLLTSIGIRPQAATYQLGNKTAEAMFAPLALLHLLHEQDRPTRAFVICTEQAQNEALTTFREGLAELTIECESVRVDDGNNTGELRKTIEQVANSIPPGCKLTIDFTHGLRHMSFLLYAVAIYLTAFRSVELRGAWYGKYEGTPKDQPNPLLDIRAMVELPRWFHAVQVFNDTGNVQALSQQFSAIAPTLPQGPERGPSQHLARALKDFSASYLAALPLETGIHAAKLCCELAKTPLDAVPGANVPLAAELDQTVSEAIKPYLFTGTPESDKRKLVLNKLELQRQASLVDAYLRFGLVPQALTVIREWVVSLGVLHHGQGTTWLEKRTRAPIERMLGAMVKLNSQQDHGPLSDEQREWATFWDQLAKRRNQLAHAGMGNDVVKLSGDTLNDQLLTWWNKIKSADKVWPVLGGGYGTLLISPVGKQPGVLFSAIKATRPDNVLALCSPQSADSARDAAREAGYEPDIKLAILEDPFAGHNSIKGLVSAQQQRLLAADNVIVNLTGGTTLMGIAVQQMFERACDLQRPGRRLILIDKRSPNEQADAPWVAGEPFWLDGPTEDNQDD